MISWGMHLSRSSISVLFVATILLTVPFIPVVGQIDRPDPGVVVKDRLDSLPYVLSNVLSPDTSTDDPWWSTTSMDEDRDKVFDHLEEQLEPGEPVPVFVDLDHTPDIDDIAMLKGLGLEVVRVYEFVDAVSIRAATPSQVWAMVELPGVVMVEPHGDPIIDMDVATPNIKARESDEYSPFTAWESGYSGKGVVITVMDTGQDNAHPGISGKWVGGIDVSKPETPWWPRDGTFDADDTNGHGTTCAGIATSHDETYKGVAYDSKLVDLRIGTMVGYAPGEGPQNFYDATIQGTEWAIQYHDHAWQGADEDHQGFEILSLSWGNDVGGSSDGKDVYSRGIDQLGETGVIPIVAAGNAGPNNDGFSGLGAADLAITIAATDDDDTVTRDDDFLAEYSSRGPRRDDGDDNPYEEMKPDVAAPGTHINGLTFERTGDGSGGTYGNRGSGTSYSTPVVAGLVALMLEANSNLTLDLVREILHFTAERRGSPMYPELDPFWDKDFGWGIVDAYNATRVAANVTPVEDFDTNLQAFIMNITTDTYPDKVVVEGIAWHKMGAVEHVEVSLDGKSWKKAKDMANDTWAKWVFNIPKSELKKGVHIVKARAVASEKHSLEHEATFEVTGEGTIGLGAGTPWFIWAILALAVIGGVFYYYWRTRRAIRRARRTKQVLTSRRSLIDKILYLLRPRPR